MREGGLCREYYLLVRRTVNHKGACTSVDTAKSSFTAAIIYYAHYAIVIQIRYLYQYRGSLYFDFETDINIRKLLFRPRYRSRYLFCEDFETISIRYRYIGVFGDTNFNIHFEPISIAHHCLLARQDSDKLPTFPHDFFEYTVRTSCTIYDE